MCFLAREGGRSLASLSPRKRAEIISNLANSLIENQADILTANKQDLDDARNSGSVWLLV